LSLSLLISLLSTVPLWLLCKFVTWELYYHHSVQDLEVLYGDKCLENMLHILE
jgi:hypothetical protein